MPTHPTAARILARSGGRLTNCPSTRASLLLAASCTIAAAGLYACTAARTIFVGDSAELAGAAACFGVPHPPGYPLYTLTTGLWTHFFPTSLRDFGANLASGFHAALAVGLIALLLARAAFSTSAVLAAAAILALGRSTWAQAVAAEVYAFDILLLAVSLVAIVHARKSDRATDEMMAGLAVGLWLGHRPLNLLYLPAIWLLAQGLAAPSTHPAARGFENGRGLRHIWRRTRSYLLGVFGSSLVYLYLPIASRANPPIDIGDPESLGRFLEVVRGAPYVRHVDAFPLSAAATRMIHHVCALPFEAGFGLILAVVGLLSLRSSNTGRRRLSQGAALLLILNLLLVSAYRVLDVASFRLPGTLAIAILGALGAERLLAFLGRARARDRSMAKSAWNPAGAAIVLLCALSLPLNFRANDLHRDDAARVYGEQLLRGVPRSALLFTQGDTVTHVLWYLQGIERQRTDLLLVSTGHASEWYFDQLARRSAVGFPRLLSRQHPEGAYRALLESQGATRPVAFTFSPALFAERTMGPWWQDRTVVPSGLALTAPRSASLDRDSLAAANVTLWNDLRSSLPGVREAADLETQAIGVEYAVAMQRTAEFLERRGRGAEARDLYRSILALQPDRWSNAIARANARIGRPYEALDLERRARLAEQSSNP